MLRKMSTEVSIIANNLKVVLGNIHKAADKRPQALQYVTPRLVAVSKTKSTDMIIEAYDSGQRHFGENYIQELAEKGNDIEILDHCEEIKWHFIGRIQRNKVAKLLGVPNLYMVETVDNERLAKAINDSWEKLNKPAPLKCMAQVNTSGEENKGGCTPDTAVKLTQYIQSECPKLDLVGLMTIGSFDHDPKAGTNPDFQMLVQIREKVCSALNLPVEQVELSMGMSADYEHAIELGSTNIRVGSTIFGARSYPQSKQTLEEAAEQVKGQEDDAADSSTSKMQNLSLNSQ